MKILAALFFAVSFSAVAQAPQVPHKMEFAGITLTIRDDARREIQKDVDALTQSPRHYNVKVERAKTYFPIIEKVFAEEQVPDDFKYLALQESALIADAVSSSNAVGFWQFKDFTAIEMGLRVDKEIDERLNIVSSSRAAARYFKKNNALLNNWLYALQAYQMGAGGVMRSEDQSHSGKDHIEITSKTYWYVKKYLAHKIAYEPGITGKAQTEVITYDNSNGKSLKDLAKEISIDEEELNNFNKWTKSGKIPNDRTYAVIIPVKGDHASITFPVAKTEPKVETKGTSVSSVNIPSAKKRVNGVMTMQAISGETTASFAARADVDLSKFLKWNDLSSEQQLVAGKYYFLGKKRGRAKENFHKVVAGEDLWTISQLYGVQIKKLRKFNRLSSYQEVAAGNMLWLASTRPKTDEVLEPVENAITVDNRETFNWSASTDTQAVVKSTEPIAIPGQSIIVEPPVTREIVNGDAKENEGGLVQKQDPTLPGETSEPGQASETVIETPIIKPLTHTVQPKETLYAIAKMYNVGVMDLVKWNDLDLQQGLKIGQVLSLHEPQVVNSEPIATKTPQQIIHEVKSSDTLYSIARQYGVTIKEIMDWNDKKDFSLSVGEKLKIYNP